MDEQYVCTYFFLEFVGALLEEPIFQHGAGSLGFSFKHPGIALIVCCVLSMEMVSAATSPWLGRENVSLIPHFGSAGWVLVLTVWRGRVLQSCGEVFVNTHPV